MIEQDDWYCERCEKLKSTYAMMYTYVHDKPVYSTDLCTCTALHKRRQSVPEIFYTRAFEFESEA